MSDKVIEGHLDPSGKGQGNWAARVGAEATARPIPANSPPWIRPWNALYLHAPGTDRVLDKQSNLDFACYAVNHIAQAEADLQEALRHAENIRRWVLGSNWATADIAREAEAIIALARHPQEAPDGK